MSYFQARLAEVQIPPKKPQKYLFHVPRTEKSTRKGAFFNEVCLSAREVMLHIVKLLRSEVSA